METICPHSTTNFSTTMAARDACFAHLAHPALPLAPGQYVGLQMGSSMSIQCVQEVGPRGCKLTAARSALVRTALAFSSGKYSLFIRFEGPCIEEKTRTSLKRSRCSQHMSASRAASVGPLLALSLRFVLVLFFLFLLVRFLFLFPFLLV